MGNEENWSWSEQHLVDSDILRRPFLSLFALKLTQVLKVYLLPALASLVEIDFIREEEIDVDYQQDVEYNVV